MNMYMFLPEPVLSRANLGYEDICYAVKLTGVTSRRMQTAVGGKFSGFMSGIGNVISDTITSGKGSTYLVRSNSGVIAIVSEKIMPMFLSAREVYRTIEFEGGCLKGTASFATGELENVSFRITSDKLYEYFCGDLRQFVVDFDLQPVCSYENLVDKFVYAVCSTHDLTDSIYKYKVYKKVSTLISFDENTLYLHNDKRKIDFSNIVAYSTVNGYYAFLIRENGEFELVEIFEESPTDTVAAEMNLIRSTGGAPGSMLNITVPEGIVKAEAFLSQFSVNGLSILSADSRVYLCKDSGLKECGIFRMGNDIYVKTEDGTTEKYVGCELITDTLSLLPAGYDAIFMNKDVPQPFVVNGEIMNFTVGEDAVLSEQKSYEYSKMTQFRYVADDFSCSISFKYDEVPFQIVTANSLGVYISNKQEKVCVSAQMKDYSVNQLYDCYYNRFTKNFLASTFAEIYKTEKLLNNDISVDELIEALRADENEVLRGAFKSVLNKFRSVDDLQSDLVQKVTLLELQRRKIQKMCDEWALYYPHYMATMQIGWLKNTFGKVISKDMLNTEYWKCVAQYKRILSTCNAYIQKSMNEIGYCTGKLSAALPDAVKRVDVTQNLRVTSSVKENMLKAGTDVMLGVTAALEISNIILRGYNATSPLTLSMSAKALVDSYTKDVELRKNVKAFGLQSLEWWAIFMKGIQIHILEATNSVDEYNRACRRRDTDIFKKLPEDKRNAVMSRLAAGLKERIIEGIDDKFMEIMPQFNWRISNIIEEIDASADICDMTLKEFKNNLII